MFRTFYVQHEEDFIVLVVLYDMLLMNYASSLVNINMVNIT
jgi:hypothetical protein